jgi:formylmethanofuran dehydrogenase subunit D
MGAWGMNTPSYFAIDDVHYSYTLGVEEKYLDVAIYPNPFADLLTVQGEGDQIELKELNGKTLVKCAHNGLTQLNTSYLPSGIYVLEVTSDAGSVIRKIVK